MKSDHHWVKYPASPITKIRLGAKLKKKESRYFVYVPFKGGLSP